MIDLDGFKPVNDTYGHAAGDKLLADIAARLNSVSSDIQHLCRLGGDEFAFVVNVANEQLLHTLGQSIIDAVSLPLQADGRTVSVGCSVGFAVHHPGHALKGSLLFEQADYALYHAKRTGRARTVLFSEEHETLIREQGVVEQALRNADLQNEFYPVFQPIVDLKTGEVTAFESLARWKPGAG